MIRARPFIPSYTQPEHAGVLLARGLIQHHPHGWNDTVLLDHIPASMLISSFFASFLQTIHDDRPDLLDQARDTKWEAEHKFQMDNIKRWMTQPVWRQPVAERPLG